jgi:hypothetical protein
MKLGDLFEVKNGIGTSGLEIVQHKAPNHIPFIRPASTQQRTLSGFVNIKDVGEANVYPAETLFVSTNGEGSHSFAYVSRFDFAANSDVSVLLPKNAMTLQEKLFYARCIAMNRWKFSYGRKPKGQRLKNIDLPSKLPTWVVGIDLDAQVTDLCEALDTIKSLKPKGKPKNIGVTTTTVGALFEVIYGTNLELVALQKETIGHGVNFVSRTSKNNGVSAKVKSVEGVKPIQGPVLSVAGGGSVLETFLQVDPFYSGRDLFYLKPRVKMTEEELLFYCACMRANMFRYSYGRQANKTLKELAIPDLAAIPSYVYGSKAALSKECRSLVSLKSSGLPTPIAAV